MVLVNMNTRDEINKRTQLPTNDKPVKFVKKKKSKSEELLPRIQRRIPLPRNPQIFEEINYNVLPESDSEDDRQIGDEIEASIQEAGILEDDNRVVGNNSVTLKKKRKQKSQKNHDKSNNNANKKTVEKKKKLPQFAKNVLMRGLMERKMAALAIDKTNYKFGDTTPFDDEFHPLSQAKIKRSL